jgi:putative hydrolase of the HAD superfamily
VLVKVDAGADQHQALQKIRRRINVIAQGHLFPDVLEKLGVADLFVAVTDVRDAGFNGKPYPDAYLAALKKAGATLEETLFLDDMQKYTDGWVALGGTAVLIGSPNGKPLADDAESLIRARAANKSGREGRTIRMKSIYEIKDLL